MNQFPLAVSPLEAIRFAHHEAFRIARLQYDVHSLNRANEAHVAVHDYVRFQYVYLARLETAEHPVKEPQCRLNTPRGKGWDIEPQGIVGPVSCALGSGHGFGHLLDDRDERLLVLRFILQFRVATIWNCL